LCAQFSRLKGWNNAMSNMPRSLGQRLHGLLERGDYALIARDRIWSFGTERAIKDERETSPACVRDHD